MDSAEDPGARGLRAVFYALGAVATAAGLHTVIAGARSVPGWRGADARIDGELRFYSAFYVAYGLTALRTAPRAHRDQAAVRALSGTLFGAGLARASSWRTLGAPHPLQRALLAAELALPPLVLALQRRVAAGQAAGPSTRSV